MSTIIKYIIIILIGLLIGWNIRISGSSNDDIKVIEVNADNFQEEVLESKVPVVIDVYTEWCKPCKRMAPIIERLAVFCGKKVKFVKIDAGKNRKLLGKFKPFWGIPVLIFVKNGKEIDRIIGLAPFITIHSKILLMLKEEKKKEKKEKGGCEGGTCSPPND